MANSISRRHMLRLIALGGLGGALGACVSRPDAAPSAIPAPVAPTTAPATAAPAVPTTASATAAPAVPTTAPAASPAAPTAAPAASLAATLASAASAFLAALSADGRSQASYAFDNSERTRWHWTTPQGFPRNGLPLTEMDEGQRSLAFALLQASLSPAGRQKAQDIMALQTILGNDPLRYYVTIFGDPGGAAPWGWRWEGHHYSRQFTLHGDTVTMTPFFLGAMPTTTDAGLRAMPREEDAARTLVSDLTGPLRDQAIFNTRPLTAHVTQNAVAVTPLEPVGVAYTDLAPPQRSLVDEIIATYLGTLPMAVATPLLARIDAADRAQIRFGWAGPLEPRRPHYYRLQGPSFLLEFDNSRNGGTHIHSVWRDFEQDFGRHLG